MVCGLHKAGLSMVVAGLQALGCEAGHFDPGPSVEDQVDNYQWPAFVAINAQLIAGASPLELTGAAQTMLGAFPGLAPIVLKDPKARRTLPFWHDQVQAFGGRLRVLLVLHNPGDPLLFNPTGATHWQGNLARSLRNLTNGPGDLVIIPRDGLRSDPSATLRHLAEVLDLDAQAPGSAAFQAWVAAHPGTQASGGSNAADPVAQAVFAALAPKGGVATLSAEQARALLRRAQGRP